ncbi:hypothetical protein CAPTEDRAFT_199214 [Capitella teleta]|uniref:Uncharacterized protein n=1 Tax=Capitella teleta TaxID=283909 RepID=R7T674_CAPTE|nr:hypothetical protein CAPTEDRAFT_199214 [Capitella teleta]|eukprot:ELT89034.1 hypothetical protein CAPTEDRAFT_199214 [Capitella teleta]
MGVEIKRVVQGIDFSFIAEQVALALGMWSPVDYISQREANSSAPAAALNPPQSQFGSRVVFQRGQRANVAVKPRSFVELKSFHTFLITAPFACANNNLTVYLTCANNVILIMI